jgi:hypothetical protein
VFNNLWKALIIIALLSGLFGAWRGWTNHQAGMRLTTWAQTDLVPWLDHVQKCHSSSGGHTPDPICGTLPGNHIGPPPPPPDWDS